MATKDRYQNPVIGDTVNLRLFVYNSNAMADLYSITQVDIYYLDPTAASEWNPDGRVLVQTVDGSHVTRVAEGEYQLALYLDPAIYTETGRYIDAWTVNFDSSTPSTISVYPLTLGAPTILEHLFQIYPDLWYTTPLPIVYDFDFYFQPNKFRVGTKKYIEIEIIPNVPTATDLAQYYENLVISATVTVSISKRCGDCVPCEDDLKLVVDNAPTQYRERNRAYYWLDTSQFDCGVYDIFFTLTFGENTYVSDNNQLQIYT